MKLAPRTFRIEWDLHAWAGVLASLFLFVIFFCGIFTLFREELEIWQDPALHAPRLHEEPIALDRALDTLRAQAEIPRGARIGFSPHKDTRFITAYLTPPDGAESRTLWIDPATGTAFPERSRLSGELYMMHFFYRVPGGRTASGVLAVALLIALVTGLLVHLKDLRRQWWQFRPALRLRFSSSDAHKALGVFGLPFCAVLAWSGAVLCLSSLVGRAIAVTAFAGDTQRVEALHGGEPPITRAPSGIDAPMLPIDGLVARAQEAVGGSKEDPRYLDVQHYGDKAAWARVYLQKERFVTDHYALLDAADGTVLATSAKAHKAPAEAFDRVLSDLHFACYGGLLLKLAYALLSLGVCAVIITGNLVWLDRRDPQRAHLGNRLLERLTVGVSFGLILAVAVYVAANRALPASLAHRADFEFELFLGAWALAAAGALVPRGSPRAWTFAFSAATSVLFGFVVVFDLVFVKANLLTALGRGMPGVFTVEVLLFALAMGSGALAFRLSRARVVKA